MEDHIPCRPDKNLLPGRQTFIWHLNRGWVHENTSNIKKVLSTCYLLVLCSTTKRRGPQTVLLSLAGRITILFFCSKLGKQIDLKQQFYLQTKLLHLTFSLEVSEKNNSNYIVQSFNISWKLIIWISCKDVSVEDRNFCDVLSLYKKVDKSLYSDISNKPPTV